MTSILLNDRPATTGAPNGVDRKTGFGVIRGVILAEVGPFENEDRGEFTKESLNEILTLIQAEKHGLKARWTHPTASNDGLGSFLGRFRDPVDDGEKLRADLHFSEIATKPSPDYPGRDFASYLMDRADEDPDSFECSLAPSKVRKEYREDGDGNRTGPPVWHIEGLRACDVVDKGDATHSGFLDVENFGSHRNHNAFSSRVTAFLDQMFAKHTREETEECLTGFVDRYLSKRFTPSPETPEEPMTKENKNSSESGGINEEQLSAMVKQQVGDALKPITESLGNLSKIIESGEQRREANNRAEEINALCTGQGVPELAADFIADKKLSVGDVGLRLLERGRDKNPLTSGDDTSEEKDKLLSARRSLAKEYDQDSTLGSLLSRDEYIEHGLRDQGFEIKPAKDQEATTAA